MTIGQGLYKQTRLKRQSALGTIAGTSGGYVIRRKTSTFELKREVYNTNDEIVAHQQMTSERQGTQMVDGKAAGYFSPGTYSDLFAALLRRDFTAGATTGALINVTAAVTTGAQGTFTRATGSYLTDGFKIGDVLRWTGWTTTAVANNAHNFMILALTATVMTVLALDGVAIVAKAAGDSVTGLVQGKRTYVPDTGHTNIYYTAEEWDPSISVSEVSTDVVAGAVAVKVPGNGNVELDWTMVGLNQSAPAASAYFTAPTAETSAEVVSSATGALVINGAVNVLITGIDFTIDGQATPADGCVGTRSRPDIFRKKVLVKGTITGYVTDSVMDNYSRNETEVNLMVAMTTSSAATAEFITLVMQRVKLQTSTPNDGEIGRVRSFQFTALYDSTGGSGTAKDKSSISMQDSLAA